MLLMIDNYDSFTYNLVQLSLSGAKRGEVTDRIPLLLAFQFAPRCQMASLGAAERCRPQRALTISRI
jgi:anthranilate/para-aminobenzoate synthase component II